jgi:nucleoside-diphosphate-sugar epimerase
MTQSTPLNVFVTGATGFIGGSVATHLAGRGHRVRGLTRDAGTLAQLSELGIEGVPGTLDDADVLAAECEAADVVVNAASSDHAGAVGTFIAALKGTGKTLIHTSGTSIVGGPANGAFDAAVCDETIHDPGSTWKPDEYKAPRVAIDSAVLASSHEGVRGIVFCNSLIYGNGTGLKADSVQLPPLKRLAQERGTAFHIGAGKNVWSNVHIDDVCSLYALAVEGEAPSGFYFVENGECDFRAMVDALATRLGVAGPEELPIDVAIAEFGYELAVFALGSNSRVRGTRTRQEFSWAPRWSSVTEWILTQA